MCLFVITKNLDWEILTKNLIIFKRWGGVKDEKFYFHRGSLKNPILGGFHEKPIYSGKLPKRKGFDSLQI